MFFQVLREMDQLADWFAEIGDLIGVEQSPVHHPEGDVWNHTMLVLDQAARLRSGAKYAASVLSPSSAAGFMLAALCHDLGKAVTTAIGNDGRIHAFQHETRGIGIAETFLKRITGNKKLTAYVKNMVWLHMKPNMAAGAGSKKKSTSRMFDQSADPEGLLLLARADHLGRTGAVINEEYEAFLYARLCWYREVMDRPFVRGEDLIRAGMKPGAEFSEMLAYAHKLRLAGIPKEEALRETIACGRKGFCQKKKKCTSVSVTFRTLEFRNRSHQTKLPNATDVTDEIYRCAKQLFRESWKGEPLRLIGVAVTGLTEDDFEQLSLFEDPEKKEKSRKLDAALDAIRQKYGNDKVTRASILNGTQGIARKAKAQMKNDDNIRKNIKH